MTDEERQEAEPEAAHDEPASDERETEGDAPEAARDRGDDAPEGEGSGGEGRDALEGLDESEHLSEEIREELEELEELRDRHLRLAAEFENYRKRTRQELSEARERGQAELAGRLLEAIDDLDRVLDTPAEAAAVESLKEGVEMVHRKLTKELSEAGLERMEPQGERFDPEYHEALLTTPVDDPEQDQTISRVLVDGYVFGDRLIRPARVEVRKHRPEAAEDGEDADADGQG